MRKSEFVRAVDDQFGEAYGRILLRDLVMSAVGERTAEQALAAGVPPRDVWLALCSVRETVGVIVRMFDTPSATGRTCVRTGDSVLHRA
jgi:hypothetical protein